MNYLFLIIGILLLMIVFTDFFLTVISVSGAGLVSSRLSGYVCDVFLWVGEKSGQRVVLKYAGAIITLTLITWWILGLWLGFYLLLLSDPYSVLVATSEVPGNSTDKMYFSGYVLSTMGNGDFKPGLPSWQIVIAVFSFTGFIFFTTAMTYLISVSSAVIHKRSGALFINNILRLPASRQLQHVLDNASDIVDMINVHNQHHLAYPVIHYFFSMKEKSSFIVNIWRLNRLVTSADNGAGASEKADLLIGAIEDYLDTISGGYIANLRDKDGEGLNDTEIRDKQLKKLLRSGGWDPDRVSDSAN
ncbi:ion channel [Roseivirga sp. BDSF3-8]|uniref:ion channel n=1 Tax=Roseivirga sp. BDSF3-8 TaxID=3241598 RepID=UPI0035319697